MSFNLDSKQKMQINSTVFPNNKLYDYTLKCFIMLLRLLDKNKNKFNKDDVDKVISLYLTSSKLRYTNPKLATQSLFAATMIIFIGIGN